MAGKKRIPDHAKMVFKGVLFEVWQWQQEMFDGSYETFEMLRRQDTAVVLATVGDKILMQREQQPDTEQFISMPGGRCEWGEDPLEAAKREFVEETGYVSDEWELMQETTLPGKIDWTIYTYIARNCKKVQEPQLDAGERVEPFPMSFDEFLTMADEPMFRTWELREPLLRTRMSPEAKEEFRKKLFGA
jgi:ADP-ribose pyrophosphatase